MFVGGSSHFEEGGRVAFPFFSLNDDGGRC